MSVDVRWLDAAEAEAAAERFDMSAATGVGGRGAAPGGLGAADDGLGAPAVTCGALDGVLESDVAASEAEPSLGLGGLGVETGLGAATGG